MLGLFHKKSQKTKLFIDAQPIAVPNISGVGHLLVNTISALISLPSFTNSYEIILIASPEKVHFLDQWKFNNVSIKAFPVRSRYINFLVLNSLCPPLDLYFGKGIYLFANYTTWPLIMSKSITYVHDISFLRYPDFTQPQVVKSLSKNLKKWIQKTDKLITISHFSAKEIAQEFRYPIEKIGVVYCGVDKSVFYKRDKDEIDHIANKYKLPKNYLLFVGSLEPRKNLENMIKAYSLINEKILKNYPLVLVGGDGWKNEGIKQQIKLSRQAGNKIIIPQEYVPDRDLPALYSGAIGVLFVPYYEGFGIPPIQAMACGVPVLLSNVGPMYEVGDKAAIYCQPDNIKDIKKGIEQITTDKKEIEKIIKAGLRRTDDFTWESAASTLSRYIDELNF